MVLDPQWPKSLAKEAVATVGRGQSWSGQSRSGQSRPWPLYHLSWRWTLQPTTLCPSKLSATNSGRRNSWRVVGSRRSPIVIEWFGPSERAKGEPSSLLVQLGGRGTRIVSRRCGTCSWRQVSMYQVGEFVSDH